MIMKRTGMRKNQRPSRKIDRPASTGRSQASLTNTSISTIEKRIANIVQKEGRRPRILLVHLEANQPDSWTKPLAADLAEFGFDVDISPMRQTPRGAARLAVDNDVHMLCVSVGDVANLSMLVRLADALRAENSADIRLVAGGAIVTSNHKGLYRDGVDLIIDFDTVDTHFVNRILDLLEAVRRTEK